MEEYILVDNGSWADKIYMNKEGKYITLRKPSNPRKEFRYDLSNSYYEFERITHYKTKEDKIETIDMHSEPTKLTSWFANCTLVTDDIKFAKLFIVAGSTDYRYKSPARFIANLAHYRVQSIEKWLSYDIDISSLNRAFDRIQHGARIQDIRRSINTYIGYEPTDFDKEQIKYLRSLSKENDGINSDMIWRVRNYWNPQQYQTGKKLDKVIQDPRYADAFNYTEFSYRGDKQTYNYLTHSRYGRNGRQSILELLTKWSLEPKAFCNYLLKLQYEAVGVDDLMRNYNDYLEREYEMKGQKRTKMNKYPKNWMSYYHKHHFNYQAMKSLKRALALEGKLKAYNEFKESKKYLEYKDKDYLIRLPNDVEDIANEATQQNHCLYDSYCDKILDGETVILFMRNIKHPDDSIITVEVKYNGIEQARGYNNRDPTPEEKEWLLAWCKKKGLDTVIRQHY